MGPEAAIPPERSGFMDVKGASRKGWEEASRGTQLTQTEQETRIRRVMKARKRHFLRTGPLWGEEIEEERKEMMRAPIKMVRSSRDAWEKPRRGVGGYATKYREGQAEIQPAKSKDSDTGDAVPKGGTQGLGHEGSVANAHGRC